MLIGGGNDIWATHFHLSINAITWFVRIGFFVVPVLAFIVTKRICLGLQRRDREKVLHGRESGIIKRLPHGEFVEVHEPLSPGPAAHAHRARAVQAGRDRPDGRRERCRAQASALQKLRAKLSKSYYGEDNQIPKPTAEEYQEITSGHGHH